MRAKLVAATWCLFVMAAAAGQQPASAIANAADAVVDDDRLLDAVERACATLRAAGGLRDLATLAANADGRHAEFPAVAVRETVLAPVELRARLAASTRLVGHFYHCEDCDRFHFTASSGFVVGADGLVATCYHLLEDEPADKGDGGAAAGPSPYLAVADWQGHVYPVVEVVAADRLRDVAVLRCEARDWLPLPLRPTVRAGERIWCLSNPDHLFAYFSEGLVARRFVVRGPAPGTGDEARGGLGTAVAAPHAQVATGPAHVMLQVTCDFGSGSSGAPIVDAMGNVVGMAQSTTSIVADLDAAATDVQMVARTAVPAADILALRR